jgi:hypothetical protein
MASTLLEVDLKWAMTPVRPVANSKLHRNQVMRSSQICECADLGMTQNIPITVDHDTLSVWRLTCDCFLRSLLIRGYRPKIVFGVLVVGFRPNCIAGLGLSAGERQILFIVSLRVLRTLRLVAHGFRRPTLRALGRTMSLIPKPYKYGALSEPNGAIRISGRRRVLTG